MSYVNADGLNVLVHGDQGVVQDKGTVKSGVVQTLVYNIADATAIGSTFGASDIDPQDPVIPAGAYIKAAYIISETTFTSGGAATLTVGLYNAAGSAIDADGIDATVAIAALTAADVVKCDGALAGGVLTVGAADAYVGAIYGTAVYTAGAAKVVIEYITV